MLINQLHHKPGDIHKMDVEKTSEVLPFGEYRSYIDSLNGLMRTGIYSESTYYEAISSPDTIFCSNSTGIFMPLAVPNGILNEYNFDIIPESASISTVLADDYDGISSFNQRQTMLSEDLVFKIMHTPRHVAEQELSAELSGDGKLKLATKNGIPEFFIFSAYDTSRRPDMKAEPSIDLLTPEGHLVTSDRKKVKNLMPELVKLHKDVFKDQAVQIGYYGGLDEGSIRSLIDNPEFIPIVAIEKDTHEPLMFALFSPNFSDIGIFDWINPQAIESMINKHSCDPHKKYAITLPLVITSRYSGLGLFKYAVQLGARDSIYKTKADTSFLMYEANSLSVLFTPRIITANMNKIGIPLISASIEATFLTE